MIENENVSLSQNLYSRMNASAIKHYEWYLKILSILHEPYKLVSKEAFIRLTFYYITEKITHLRAKTVALICIAFNDLVQIKN